MPDEAPANMDDAEPLEDDRVVPFSEDSETVMVDGILMSTSCTLKVLRAGCSSLGLSGRGSKSKCLKRMVETCQSPNFACSTWSRNQNTQ